MKKNIDSQKIKSEAANSVQNKQLLKAAVPLKEDGTGNQSLNKNKSKKKAKDETAEAKIVNRMRTERD